MDLENNDVNNKKEVRKFEGDKQVQVGVDGNFSQTLGVSKFKDFFNNRKTGQQKESYFVNNFGAKPTADIKNENFKTKEQWNEAKYIHDNVITKIIPKSIIEHKVGSDLDLKNKKINLEFYSTNLSTNVFDSSPLYAITLVQEIFNKLTGKDNNQSMMLKYINIKSVEAVVPIDGLNIVGYLLRQVLLSDEDTYITGTSLLDKNNLQKTYTLRKENATFIEIGKDRIILAESDGLYYSSLKLDISSVTAKFCGTKTFKLKDTRLQKDHVIIDLYGKPGIVNSYDFGGRIGYSILVKYSITLSEILSITESFWEKTGEKVHDDYLDYILDVIFSPNVLLTFDLAKLDFIKKYYASADITKSPRSLLAQRINLLVQVCPAEVGFADPKEIVDKKKMTPYTSLFQKCIDFAKNLKGAYLKGSSNSLNIKLAEFFNQRFIKAKKKEKKKYTEYTDYSGIVVKNENNEKILEKIKGVNSKIPIFLKYIDDLVATTKNKTMDLIFNYKDYTKVQILNDIEPYLKFLYGEKEQWGYTSINEWIREYAMGEIGDTLPYEVVDVKKALISRIGLLNNKRQRMEEEIKKLISEDSKSTNLATKIRMLKGIKANLLKEDENWKSLNNLEYLNPIKRSQVIEEIQNELINNVVESNNNYESIKNADKQINKGVVEINKLQEEVHLLKANNDILKNNNGELLKGMAESNIAIPIKVYDNINVIHNPQVKTVSIKDMYSHMYNEKQYWGKEDYIDYRDFINYIFKILMTYNSSNVEKYKSFCINLANFVKLEEYFWGIKTLLHSNETSIAYDNLITLLIQGENLTADIITKYINDQSILYFEQEDQSNVDFQIGSMDDFDDDDVVMDFSIPQIEDDKQVNMNIDDNWGDIELQNALNKKKEIIKKFKQRRQNKVDGIKEVQKKKEEKKMYDYANYKGMWAGVGRDKWSTVYTNDLTAPQKKTLYDHESRINKISSKKAAERLNEIKAFNNTLLSYLKDKVKLNVDDDSTEITKVNKG